MDDLEETCSECGQIAQGNYWTDPSTGEDFLTYQCSNMTCLNQWDAEEANQ